MVQAYHGYCHNEKTYGDYNLANHIKQTVFTFIHLIIFFYTLYIYKYGVILKSFYNFAKNVFFNPKIVKKWKI